MEEYNKQHTNNEEQKQHNVVSAWSTSFDSVTQTETNIH